jgi:hypothetical protein
MSQPNWPLSRCIICSVLFGLLGYGAGIYVTTMYAANTYGDYRAGLRGGLALVPLAAALAGLIPPWIMWAMERRRENPRKNGGSPN